MQPLLPGEFQEGNRKGTERSQKWERIDGTKEDGYQGGERNFGKVGGGGKDE